MTIYTIGHSNLKLDSFFSFLHQFNIQLLVDIRSIPYSKYQPQFNYDSFKENVNNEGFIYVYLGEKIGGKYSDHNLQFVDGGIDYSKVAFSRKFIEGIDELINLSQKYANIVIMCVEKDPYYCHRFALISHALSKKNIISKHILPNEEIIVSNTELEGKMKVDYGEKYSLEELYSHHNWVLFHKKESNNPPPVNKDLFGADWNIQNNNQNTSLTPAEKPIGLQNKKKTKSNKKTKSTNSDKNQKLSGLY